MAENLNLKTVETVDTRPFRKLVMTIGELPTSFIESMTYYELLAWFTNYLETVIIPTVNNNGEAVEELQEKYIELKTNTEQEIDDFENEITTAFNTLKNFVDNYFDNLDVQEEINNKLDEMAEQGILQEIITTYIQSNVAWTFDTVADMKLATNLVNGSFAQTLGFYSRDDEGGALYKITNTGTANEINVIAIANSLFAHLVPQSSVNVKQLGAKGNGTDNDSASIAYACNNYHDVLIPTGTYLISQNITLTGNYLTVRGENDSVLTINTAIGFDINNLHHITFDGLKLTSPTYYEGDTSNRIISIYGCHDITITNNEICYGKMGVPIGDTYNITIANNLIHDFKGWGIYLGGNQTLSTESASDIKNCRIYNNESYNSTYDGIKMTGYIENVMVYNNICHDNTRDGFDWAGHSAKNVEVFDNLFYDNTLCGTDFKTLTRTTYPFDDTKTKQVESIHFHDNICYRNMSHELNFQLQYSDNNYNNIVVENNVVKIQNKGTTTSEADGIRVAPIEATVANAMIIKNNTIYGDTDSYGNGIRLTNTNNVLVKDNEATGIFRRVCYVDYNSDFPGTSAYNTFDNNLLVNNRTSSNVFNTSASTTYITLINNKMHSVTTSYIIDANTIGESTNVFNNNTDTAYYSATPTGRTTKNIIYLSNDPATTGCVGWIGYENNSSARYRVYIPIAS